MSNTTNLTAAESLAISKLTSKGRPSTGVHHIDTVVRIKGTVTVGEDYERTPTVSIPLKEVLALFIQRAGITREASVTLLRSAMTEALLKGSKGQGAIEASTTIDEVMKEIVTETTRSLPKQTCAGRVTTKLEVERV